VEEGSVASVLRAHGLSDRAIQVLLAVGEDIRVRTERLGIEFAATLDAASGRQVGPTLTGSSHGVPLTGHLDALI
jgi:hypothetical protein